MTTSLSRRSAAFAAAVAVMVGVQVYPTPARVLAEEGTGVDLGPVQVTKTVTRTHLEADGAQTVADTRTVTLSVSQTKGLRSRQPVRVTWKGAHPTGGITGDPTGENANGQEYPFVLLECRGVDSPDAPEAQRIRPETCWTGTMRERTALDPQRAFGPWRLDRYATPAERSATPGVLSPLPKACADEYASQGRWVHFVSAAGKEFASDGSPDSVLGRCGTAPAEAVVVANSNQPSNNQYAPTDARGEGFTKFTSWTSEDNASLGCGGAVACSLVAIPVMGISCDETAAGLPAADVPPAASLPDLAKNCRAAGVNKPGSLTSGLVSVPAVRGQLWWAESNWRNRITVPLSFAPLASVCDLTSARDSVDVYGSELLTSLTSLWRPAFCLSDSRTPFKHIQLPEPQAANLLRRGNVSAAFVTRPPAAGFSKTTVLAPVALTGFAISYAIDGDDKEPYRSLRLTPRLIAKLLTASYPGLQSVKLENEALSRNPLDMTLDPEFQAINPGIPRLNSSIASTLANLSSDSDVVFALTSYLNADPETRDFLYGVPDAWGMVVNPKYRRISLPVSNWPLLDDFQPRKDYANGTNLCLQDNPVPIVPLVQAPTSRLSSIAAAVQFAAPLSQLTCSLVDGAGSAGGKLVTSGRLTPGRRFVVGLTSLADALRYDLDTASLQTTVSTAATEKFVDDRGRDFASPTVEGLRTAASRLTLDATTGAWTYPYTALTTDATASAAYPGTMVVSMAVPGKGLSAAEAEGYASLLQYAAGEGQVPGLDIGDLPPGYLPMTDANNLARQRDQLLRAAPVVAAQSGASVPAVAPSPTPAPVASTTTPQATPSATAAGSATPTSTATATASPTPSPEPQVTPVLAPTPTPALSSGGDLVGEPVIEPSTEVVPTSSAASAPPRTAAPKPTAVPVLNLGATPRSSSALSASLFPALLVLAVLLGAAAGLLGRRPRLVP